MLEYRNRTWSNLDLAMRLKKDIMLALISHTGAIIQNKLTHHRPEKPQGNLLRMVPSGGAQSSRPGTAFGNPQSGSDAFSLMRPATAAPSRSAPSIFRNDSLSTSGLTMYGASSAPSIRTATDDASISEDTEVITISTGPKNNTFAN